MIYTQDLAINNNIFMSRNSFWDDRLLEVGDGRHRGCRDDTADLMYIL